MGVRSIFTVVSDTVSVKRIIFPSTDKSILGERYTITNLSDHSILLYIPYFSQSISTLEEMGVYGSYIISTDIIGSGTFALEAGESRTFDVLFQARKQSETPVYPDLAEEFEGRLSMLGELDANLVLETPDPILNREFRFAKIRASESIFKTAGGYMHAPGGEAYYAAIWANDQAEYMNPFFPFLGYWKGNESALNSYLHFMRFVNPNYNPLPSSIIAEGSDIWNGAGDRGDAAMIAYGASRYLLAKGSAAEAKRLWPLVEWCLEYCKRKLNSSGVVVSDTDELEGRFPSGEANLCTSCLYYDALLSAQLLCRELGEGSAKTRSYAKQASDMERNIEKYFGAEIGGYHTYRYFKGNTLLRSWICMPLIVGLHSRAQGTIAALTSPALMTDNGLLTQEGSDTYWDRATLYAIRGIFYAGDTQTAYAFMHGYSERRLLGDHVPYPIEAWPEGSQRHLSAESGLFCRAITEGLFGIRPRSFNSFDLTPRLPDKWDSMALRHVRAFGSDFDIEVIRKEHVMKVIITNHLTLDIETIVVPYGRTLTIEL